MFTNLDRNNFTVVTYPGVIYFNWNLEDNRNQTIIISKNGKSNQIAIPYFF